MPDPPNILKLKIAFLGEEGVGKTSLIHRFVAKAFDESYIRTMGVLVSKKTVTLTDVRRGPIEVHVIVFDLMGKQTFLSLFKESCLQGAQGILAVFDVTRRGSLQALSHWIDAAHRVVGEVPIYVLGNKADLRDRREVGEEEASGVLNQFGCPVLYTSAKTGENVDEAFHGLSMAIIGAGLEAQL